MQLKLKPRKYSIRIKYSINKNIIPILKFFKSRTGTELNLYEYIRCCVDDKLVTKLVLSL